jgi:hypothetical protein
MAREDPAFSKRTRSKTMHQDCSSVDSMSQVKKLPIETAPGRLMLCTQFKFVQKQKKKKKKKKITKGVQTGLAGFC